MTNKLVRVLTRFRREKVALTCDVEQMFHSFKVNKEHKDYLRFLWFQSGDLSQLIVTYRMNVRLFGVVSNPAYSNFGLHKTAQESESEFGETAASFLRDDFYVDDGLKAVNTTEPIDIIKNSQGMCAKVGLRVHKFTSNSNDVLETVPVEDRAKEVKNLDLPHTTQHQSKDRLVLTAWCVESDSLQFRITLKDKPFTFRGILSTVSSVYDPLGIVCPVILDGKLLLRELLQQKADWDDPVPDDVRPRWENGKHN